MNTTFPSSDYVLDAPQPATLLPPALSPTESALPFFPVATHKFVVLSICTLGLYELYWCYQNWKRLKATSRERLSPFWRSVFAPLWSVALFGRIRKSAALHGLAARWSPGVLAVGYLMMNATWRLPDPWWLISLATLIPMIPVQRSTQQVNAIHASLSGQELSSAARNHRYSAGNIVTIILGGLVLLAAIAGTLLRPCE